jgi:hypothetical protein
MYVSGLSTRDIEESSGYKTSGKILLSKDVVRELTKELWEDNEYYLGPTIGIFRLNIF